jgi:hypothetical protein
LAEKPDVAIIAVGASSIIPKIPGVEKWLENFYQWLKGLDLGEKILICRDMNVVPEPIDVHSPEKLKNHVCFHEMQGGLTGKYWISDSSISLEKCIPMKESILFTIIALKER